MIEDSIISMIGSLGFPIAVTIYLLVERGKALKELVCMTGDLKLAIEKLTLIMQEKQ